MLSDSRSNQNDLNTRTTQLYLVFASVRLSPLLCLPYALSCVPLEPSNVPSSLLDSDSDLESDLDSKPYDYIVLCRTCFHCTDSDSDLGPFSKWASLPNGCCTHFRARFLSQGQVSIPITYISIRGSEFKPKPMEKSCIVQESMSKFKSESKSGNGNKPLDFSISLSANQCGA